MNIAKLDKQLCFALYSASNRLTEIYRPILKPLNLTYTQFVVLMALWEKDNVSISQLANRTGLSKATMTPLLRRLEEKSLIKLERVPNNDRQKNVALTQAGQRLSTQSVAATEAAFCATGLTKQQAMDAIALCQQIAR